MDGGVTLSRELITVAGVIVTAILTWLGTRLVGKAALENAVTATIKEVLEQLRTELRVALKERDTARQERDDARAVAKVQEERIEELVHTIAALELRIASATLPRVL